MFLGACDADCAVAPDCASEVTEVSPSAPRTLSSDAAATALPGSGESDCVRNADENTASAVETATIAAIAIADKRCADNSRRFICFLLGNLNRRASCDARRCNMRRDTLWSP